MVKPSEPHMFSNLKMDLIAAVGEFMGTFVFLLVGLGGIQAAQTSNADNSIATTGSNSVPNVNVLMYAATSMGLSLLFSCWIFFRATGAAFNPNVSLALLLIGIISPLRFVLYTTAQLLASMAACAVLQALLPGPLAVSTTLGAGTRPAQGLFIEVFITCGLVLSVLFLAVEKHKATFLAPVGIGITLFAGHLFVSYGAYLLDGFLMLGIPPIPADLPESKRCQPIVFLGSCVHGCWYEYCAVVWSCSCLWVCVGTLDLLVRSTSTLLVMMGFESPDSWQTRRSAQRAGRLILLCIMCNRVGPTLGSLLAVAIYAFMKLVKYWKLSEEQDTDIPSKSPILFTTPAGPMGATAKRADPEKIDVPATTMPERVCWQAQSASMSHPKNYSPASNEAGMV